MQVHMPTEGFLWLDLGICSVPLPRVRIIATGQMRVHLVGRTGSLYGVIQTNLTSFFLLVEQAGQATCRSREIRDLACA